MRILAAAVAVAATPVAADIPASARWIADATSFPLRIMDDGRMAIAGGAVIAADPLTYAHDAAGPWIAVPETQARLFTFVDRRDGSVSKTALVFAAADPVCGEEVAAIAVDTGTAAFFDRPNALALDALAQRLAARGGNIYNDFFADEMPLTDFSRQINLDGAGVIFAFSSGYGDGIYPVFRLYGADGATVAVYADFTGINETDWLEPQSCGKPAS